MGLDTSHGCWHGAYSAFMRWRREIARAAGQPPLDLMEGFYLPGLPIGDPFYKIKGLTEENPITIEEIKKSLPIKWDALKPSALHILLKHSDCEGEIKWEDCSPIADALETLIPKLPKDEAWGHIGNWRDKTQAFINGLRLAASQKENVDFH